MKEIKLNDICIDALKTITLIGQLYKDDWLTYLRCLSNNTSYYHNRLLQYNLTETYTVTKLNGNKSINKTIDVVRPTSQGRNLILELYPETTTYIKNVDKKFHITNIKRLDTLLTRGRDYIVMTLNHSLCFPFEKPSLNDLYCYCNNLSTNDYDRKGYYLIDEQDELLYMLKKGIYYSANEFRTFTKNIYGSLNKNDLYNSSRFTGIYFKLHEHGSNPCCQIYVLYNARKGDNSILYINEKAEATMLEIVQEMFGSYKLNAYRNTDLRYGCFETSHKALFKYWDMVGARQQPSAVIISDSVSLAYATASGRKRGKSTEKSEKNFKRLEDNPNEEEYGRTKNNETIYRSHGFLKGISLLKYDGIFVAPFQASHLNQIFHILNNDCYSEIEQCYELVNSSPHFSVIEKSSSYIARRYRNAMHIIVYMPVLDTRKLRYMRELNDKYKYIIITHEELTDAIARAIKTDAVYYDIDKTTDRVYSNDRVMIYNEYGYPKGMAMLQDKLKKEANLNLTEIIFKSVSVSSIEMDKSLELYSKNNKLIKNNYCKAKELCFIRFSNAIATGSNDILDNAYNYCVEHQKELGIKAIDTTVKKRRSHYTSMMISLPKSSLKKLKVISSYSATSASAFIRPEITKAINNSYDEIASNQNEQKKDWKYKAAIDDDALKCKNCGCEVRDTDAYCSACGSKL